jgi:hypothetical protein
MVGAGSRDQIGMYGYLSVYLVLGVATTKRNI